ncbi:MAG: sialidase family protein [Gaiellaceae bacterium]
MAAGANDYRMVTVTLDVWLGFYVSDDEGATWFNTFVPGFPSDTSAAGSASPLKNLDASGDPVVRFAPDGDLLVAGIAFNRNFDQPDRPVDNLVYVARYDYTPGSPGGLSTPNSAANPPDFTYAGTTVVERGAVGFAVPGAAGFVGTFTDKEWMEADLNSASASDCAGNVYVAHTDFHASGSSAIMVSVSDDGGATFSPAKVVSTGGRSGTPNNQGADIAVGADGAVYVAYNAFERSTGANTINIMKSTDCGRKWSQPVVIGPVVSGQAPGVVFRTPTFAFVATDDTDADVVYAAYQSRAGGGDYDIYVQRSTNGGATWGPAVQVNGEGASTRHQIFPTIEVSNGALHVAWYDFQNSVTATNEALDVYYACTNCSGAVYPVFDAATRVTDVSHNGNCLTFGGGTSAFHGDYNELDAYWNGMNHIVHVAWADNRDVTPCDTDPAPGPASNNTGNRNQNIYADQLTVGP